VQNLKARAYWLTDVGVAADSGLIDFTTTVVSSSPGTQVWTTPDNARVDDSNYTTAVASGTSQSQDLVFDLGDLGVPSTATLTGLSIQLKGKSTDVTRTNLWAYVSDNTGAYTYTSLQFADFTTNNVDDTKTLGTSSTVWGLDVIRGATAALLQIKSADTLPPATVSAGSTSVGVAGGTTSVSSYGVWYDQGYASFTAQPNEVVSISEYIISTISSVSSTGSDILNVYIRTRLYNNTTSTDVPGGIDQHLIFSTFGATTFGNLVNISNISKTFIAGFRGLLIPGNDYRLYIEITKVQATGTPTCSVSVNKVSTSVSGAALLS
jgi:hypothetical protein